MDKNSTDKDTATWYNTNPGTLKERLERVKTSRWIRFAIVAAIFIAWVAWLGSWWVLIFLFLLADIYLTQFIPWAWWKKSKNAATRTVMGWVDAILYALILVYFIFAFIGQNYQIPSSSLEKTLLTGDFLWVNKMIYGPRVPMTPVHFPLTQNTLPILNTRSYLDEPQLAYHRLKGFRDVERNDIVVFNFPAGDTIASKMQNPDYYVLVQQFGRDRVWNDKSTFGEIMYRPVDRRENYVKRAIGLPGERLMMKDGIVYINGEALKEPEKVQYNYYVQTSGGAVSQETWNSIDMANDDVHLLDIDPGAAMGVLGLGLSVNDNGTINPIYQVPLTYQAKNALASTPGIAKIVKIPTDYEEMVYPVNRNYGWNHANYGTNIAEGGILIPKKGETLLLTESNLPIYERVIRNYEGNTLEVKDGKILINGKQTDRYTFKMNYYWMMGDNRDNSADSRYWGFVPEDHVVGSPMFIIVSLDKDKGWFNGKIRWNRIFRDANPDK